MKNADVTQKILDHIEEAPDIETKVAIIEQLLNTVRGETFIEVAGMLEKEGADPRVVQNLFVYATTCISEEQWDEFEKIVNPKDCSLLERLLQAFKGSRASR